ncbi:MAG TPA: hypothetical protein VF546_13375 [Pyrinomonadaceae bacterium]
MRRAEKEKALATLDEIERLTSVPGRDGGAVEIGLPGIDGRALDLMVKVARGKDSLKLLVERYSASRSVVIVGALLFVLLKRAESTTHKDAYLLFDFIENLQRKDNPGVLVTTLTAIGHQIGLAQVWQRTRMPESLYPFLQHCLDFAGVKANWIHRGLSDAVQLGAIDILLDMCRAKIFALNFAPEQRRWLESKAKEIADLNTDHAEFQARAASFLNCLQAAD